MGQELEEVIGWLEAGEQADYQAGVLVLQKHCRNRSLVAGLLRKESAANREKLVYELCKCLVKGRMDDVSEVLNHFAQAVQGAVPSPAGTPDIESAQPAPDEVLEAARAEVDALTELMGRLYNERCQLSNSLADLTPEDTPAVVAKILSLQEQYNALAQKRRNLVEGGQPAPADETAPAADAASGAALDRAGLVQQRANLRSNVSKTKAKLDKAQTEDKRSELAQKVAKLEIELDGVERQLKQPQA